MNYTTVISFSVILQCIFFCGFILVSDRKHRTQMRILLTIFIAILLSKTDDVLQITGLLTYFPHFTLTLGTFGLLIAPAYYFYVRSRIESHFVFKSKHLWHGALLLPPLIHQAVTWWPLSGALKIAAFKSGDIATLTNTVIWPVYGDLVTITYLLLSLNLLRKYGIKLQHWFSRLEDKNLSGLRLLFNLMLIMLVTHIGWSLYSGIFKNYQLANVIMSILSTIHLIIVNGLMLEILANPKRSMPNEEATYKPSDVLLDEEVAEKQRELIKLLDNYVSDTDIYLDPDLSLMQLATAMKVSARQLSQAINSQKRINFFEYINRLRIDKAKTLFTDQPSTSVLDVAYASGFNSKSAFNTAFKKYTQITPSGYKRAQI